MKSSCFLKSVAVVALTALVAISCEREEPAVPATTSTNLKSSQKPSVHACCYPNMTESKANKSGGICCDGGQTCAGCVIVVGSASVHQIIEEVHELIRKPAADVAKYFFSSDKYLELLPALATDNDGLWLKALQKGEYIIEDIIATDESKPSAILFAPVKDGKPFAISYWAVK
jgi:hypothetical protein